MPVTSVAVVQMTSTPDVTQNLDTVERLACRAHDAGAKLTVLPECFAYLGPESGLHEHAESLPDGGPILGRCQALARELSMELLLGGFPETAPSGRVYNTSILLG